MALVLGVDFERVTDTPAYRSLSGQPSIDLDLWDITTRLLDLLARHEVTATFFVVADIAVDSPELVRRIADAGHEIASHTLTHESLTGLPTGRLREEVRKSRTVLQNTVEADVLGFRAPTFQIDDDVYRALLDAGYAYSSSVMPGVPIPGFYANRYDFTGPTTVTDGSASLLECPVTVSPYLRVPVSGTWTRLLGRQYTIRSIRHRLRNGGDAVTYVHPWEFADLGGSPMPLKNKIRTGEWLFETYDRLLGATEDAVSLGEYVQTVRSTGEHSLHRSG